MSSYKEPEPVRQWCEYCQAATPTWTDSYGEARCARHDGPDRDDYDDDWEDDL